MCPGEMLLEDLHDNIPNKGMMLVARDGTVLSARCEENLSHETFAIMSATMVGAALTACREVCMQHFKRIVIEAEGGRILVYPAGKRNILVLAVDSIDEKAEGYIAEALEGLGSV